MTEFAFPLLGTALVVLVVLPAFALLAKAALVVLERDEVGGPLHGLTSRYVLLTGASFLPICWFVSAGLHQAETSTSVMACLIDHDTAELCFESAFFALALAVAVLASSIGVVRKHRRVRVSSSDSARTLLQRVSRIVANDPVLAELLGRVTVSDDESFALGTYGLLRPRIVVGAKFAAGLCDVSLASALGHEAEHVRALDPLRYFVLDLALAVNPFGRFLLGPHAGRWRAAREAHCDREAVIRGAAPLPLADAIVRAARPMACESVALGTNDTTVLKFRIGMLLAYAEREPVRCCHRGPSAFPVALVLLFVALLLPHQTGTVALDALHSGAELALTYFWR